MIKTGLDSHSLFPLNLKPHQVLQWAHDNGAEGVLFSEPHAYGNEDLSVSYIRDLGQMASDLGLYIEWGGGQHLPFNTTTWDPFNLLQVNLKAAGEAAAAGATIIRSSSGGMVRANPGNPATAHLMKAATGELRRMVPMLRDNGVVLAIETNFEFTTFELLKIFEKCEVEPGDCLGICLNTFNLLTMLEDPVQATSRIAPWVVSTRIQDGGLVFNDAGMTAFPSAVGSGIIDLRAIVSILSKQTASINFSVFSSAGRYLLPVHEPWYISQFKDLTISEYNNLMLLENRAEELIESQQLVITRDNEWEGVCEARLRSDLKKLKELAANC
jgi:3-oxoisoapionate decarboxylase